MSQYIYLDWVPVDEKIAGVGRYSHYRYTIDTEINRYYQYCHHAAPIQVMVTAAKQRLFRKQNYSLADDIHTIKENT